MWCGRIELARRYRDLHGNTDDRWKNHVKAVAGDFNSKDELGEEAIDVNITHASLEVILGPLALNEPQVTVEPTRKTVEIGGQQVDNVMHAEFTAAEINYWLRELEVQKTAERCLLDMETTNHMYALVWYAKKGDVTGADGERSEPDPKIQPGRPIVKRIAPHRVLVPPGACELEDHEWCAIEWWKRKKDVMAEYPDIPADKLPTGEKFFDEKLKTVGRDITQAFSDYLDSDDNGLVKVIQVFCKRTGKIYKFADGYDELLDEEDWDLETEGFPLAHVSGTYVPDEYYGTPPMQYAMPQQKEKNAGRTSLRKKFNRTKGVTFVASDIADEVKEAIKNAEDGEIIPIDLHDKPIRDVLMEAKLVPADPSDLIYDREITSDYREVIGLSAEQRGGGDPNIETATQSATVEKWAQIRSGKRGGRLRDFYLQICRKIWMILQQRPNIKRDRLVAGPNAGLYKRLRYTLGDLRGEFNFRMDVTSLITFDPVGKIQQAVANYNLLRADPMVNPERLLLDMLAAQNIRTPEDYLLTLRQPDEEHQMMEMGLPVEAHIRDDHQAHERAHSILEARLLVNIEQLQNAPEDERTSMALQKMNLMASLLLAHVNSHAQKVQELVAETGGGGPRPPGQPVSENQLRSSQAVQRGQETAAEVLGQPISRGPEIS